MSALWRPTHSLDHAPPTPGGPCAPRHVAATTPGQCTARDPADRSMHRRWRSRRGALAARLAATNHCHSSSPRAPRERQSMRHPHIIRSAPTLQPGQSRSSPSASLNFPHTLSSTIAARSPPLLPEPRLSSTSTLERRSRLHPRARRRLRGALGLSKLLRVSRHRERLNQSVTSRAST